MSTWTTETWLAGVPDEILELLTEPEAISRWSPIPFELLELDDERLRTGSRARIRGPLAGRQVEFDVEIEEADDGRLSLFADGPVAIDAQYVVQPTAGGSVVRASVSVSGSGLIGGVLARAADALLAAGMLRVSVARLGEELELAVAA